MKTVPEGKKGRGRYHWILPLLLVLTTIATALALFWSQRSANLSGKKEEALKTYDRYYAFISDEENSSFWKEVYEGAHKEGEDTDAFVEDFASDLAVGYSLEERIRIAVASGVDGIIVENVNRNAEKNEIAAATEAGIPVVLVGGNDDAGTGRISYVGISRYDLGGLYGRQVVILAKKLLNDRKRLKITVLTGKNADAESQKLLISTIRDSVSADADLYGRIDFETREIDDFGTFASQRSVTELLMDPENVPDILVALNEEHTNSAYQAAVDNNVVGQCSIIGYYDSESIRKAIENEILSATITVDAVQMGKDCTTALNEYLDSGYVSEYFMADTYVVDKETVKAQGGEE